MPTNIVTITAQVVVTLVTNVSEQLPTQRVMIPCPGATSALVCFEDIPVPNPTTKLIVTTIKEVHTATFNWLGEPHIATRERVISETRKQFTKTTDWKEQP